MGFLVVGAGLGLLVPSAAAGAALFVSLPYLLEAVEALFAVPRAASRRASAASPIVVIPALLDNERSVLRATVESWLATDAEAVVVCANGEEATLLAELEDLADRSPRLRLDYHPAAQTKAANLNRVLKSIAATDVDRRPVRCVDADVRPLRNTPRSDGSATILQGVRLIRRHNDSTLEAFVRCEYFLKSFVTYPARDRLFRVAYFGGSNAVFDADALGSLYFRESAVVEDVDLAVRTLLDGGTVAYDDGLQASEEAPPTWGSWAVQRHRWSSGWVNLAWQYSRAVARSTRLTVVQRVYWSYLLGFRKLVVPPAGVLLAVAAVQTGRLGPWMGAMVVAPWLRFATCTWVARRTGASCHDSVRPTRKETATATLLAPVYAAAGFLVDVAALAYPPKTWRPTARTTR